MTARVLVVCAVLFCAAPAIAAPITFFGEDLAPVAGPPVTNIPNANAAEAAFIAALADYYTFDAEAGLGSTPAPGTFVGPGGNLPATFFGDVTASPLYAGGPYAISGTNVLGGTEGWTLVFSRPMNGFGLYGIGVPGTEPQESPIRFQVTFTNGDVEDFISPSTLGVTTPTVGYFGFIDNARTFTRVQIRGTVNVEVELVSDDVTAGTVPEPATALLTGLGLAGVALLRRRRRSN